MKNSKYVDTHPGIEVTAIITASNDGANVAVNIYYDHDEALAVAQNVANRCRSSATVAWRKLADGENVFDELDKAATVVEPHPHLKLVK